MGEVFPPQFVKGQKVRVSRLSAHLPGREVIVVADVGHFAAHARVRPVGTFSVFEIPPDFLEAQDKAVRADFPGVGFK